MARIVAVVSLNSSQVSGGAPIFIVKTPEELQQTSFMLEKIMDASAHDLKNGTMIVVDHKSS